MCVMASVGQNRLTKQELLLRLLHGSSPRNPTYVLSRILANFTAQGPSELSVRSGEEVFILFEINDWAFVTVFANTKRRGYVPLDYCDVVKDFYEFPSKIDSKKVHRRGERKYKMQQIEDNSNENDVKLSTNESSEPTNDELCYYDDSEDGLQCTLSGSANGSHHPITKKCCCCCNHHAHNERKCSIDHVLKYLSETELHSSPPEGMDGSESGLGDSESVQSAGDLMLTGNKQLADFNDISTQTSKSLEDIYEISTSLPTKYTHFDSHSYSCGGPEVLVDELPVQDLLPPPQYRTPLPTNSIYRDSLSCESGYSDSAFESSINSPQSTKPKACEMGSTSGVTSSTNKHANELYENMKRFMFDDDVISIDESEDETFDQEAGNDSSKTLLSNQDELRRRLALPILHKVKQVNRVELTRLSERIKEKLKPARDDLINLRQERTPHSVTQVPTEADQPININEAAEDATDKSTPSTNVSRKQRRLTLQSIQEQYLKLEEARLLHNALKHLNQAMATSDT